MPLPAGATVAVIGPNAAHGRVMGGGSSQLSAHRKVSPLDGLRAALGEDSVTYALGCENDRFLPTLDQPIHIEYLGPEDEVLASEERQRQRSDVVRFSGRRQSRVVSRPPAT